MRTGRLRASLALLSALTGCGESAGPQPSEPSAGSAGTGAVTSAGGSAGRGGSGGNGGTSAAGGASGSGGTSTAGSGTGGTSSSGGKGGSAGSAPAGSGGLAGGPAGMGGTASGGAGASNGGTATAGGASPGGSGGAAGGGAAGGGAAGAAGTPGACSEVTPVPEAVRTRLDLDPFYEKHADANGLSVLGSSEPTDESLLLACRLVNNMLAKREDVRAELVRRRARFAIIGRDEGTAEIPEYGYRDRPQSEIDYINQRARGLGGIVASCGEENILCLDGDRYPRESICVHEFAHTISMYGTYSAEEGFEDALEDAFEAALASGILDDTYRNSNLQEYWAEGVQDWYDTNDWSNPPNGIHNGVNTRPELEEFDPTLYALVSGMFPEDTAWGDCRQE